MYTSSKLRKIRRMQKLRRQRTAAALLGIVLLFTIFSFNVFSSKENSEKYNILSVTVEAGDTLWSIASKHKPQGEDTRKFIEQISRENNITDATIICGQTLYIPVN